MAKFDPTTITPRLWTTAVDIASVLHRHGHTVYFAGGCVRDGLLGRPVKDVDIATDALPGDIARLFPDTRSVGAHFGVMLVIADDIPFEVATFRTDLSYSNGRHPDAVAFSSPEEDACRRDFTINGLFVDPFSLKIIDYVQGLPDIEAHVVRAIGTPRQRFLEDHLRLLRAVRFAASLNFDIDPLTWDAIVESAPAIRSIAMERIREELVHSLTVAGADRALLLLEESGLLEILLPEVRAMVGLPQPQNFHPEGDVFTHVRRMFSLAEFPLLPELAMAILLHDVGKPPTFRMRERIRFDGHAEIGAEMARHIMTRFRFSREEIQRTVELVAHHLRFMHVQQMRESTLRRFLRQDVFPLHLELHRLDCLASHGDLGNYHYCRHRLAELSREKIAPPPLINGHDLIRLGLDPGPLFGRILSEIENLQLEDQMTTTDEAIEYVRQHYLSH